MKKFFLAATVFLIFSFFGISLLLSSTYEKEVSIVISAPDEIVFESLVNFELWQKWNPGLSDRSLTNWETEGFPGVVGHRSQWKNPEYGTGSQILVALKKYSFIEMDIQLQGPLLSPAKSFWRIENNDDGQSLVHWKVRGHLAYPLERFYGLFLAGPLQTHLEQGLQGLKKTIEQ